MLPRFEFGHFYKFAVSLGLILVALGLGLPWLVLRDTSGLTIPAADLDRVTPTARAVLEDKQRHQQWIVDHYAGVSIGLVALGCLVLGYGAMKWWRRQSVLDETEDVQRDTAKAQLSQMTPAEVEEKQEAELAMELAQADAIEPSPAGDHAGSVKPIGDRYSASDPRDTKTETFKAMRDVERRLTSVFGKAFEPSHWAQSNVKLSSNNLVTTLDLLLIRRELRGAKEDWANYVVELNFVSSGKTLAHRVTVGITEVMLRVSQTESILGVKASGVLVVAYDNLNLDEIADKLKGLVDAARRVTPARVRVVLVRASAIGDLHPEEVRRAVESEGRFATESVLAL